MDSLIEPKKNICILKKTYIFNFNKILNNLGQEFKELKKIEK